MKKRFIWIIAILATAIAIVGYLICQEVTAYSNDNGVTDTDTESVTILNDSTFHINLNDSMCATLQECNDTLFVDVIGALSVTARVNGDDTIRIVSPKNNNYKTYKLCYGDYFENEDFNYLLLNSRIH